MIVLLFPLLLATAVAAQSGDSTGAASNASLLELGHHAGVLTDGERWIALGAVGVVWGVFTPAALRWCRRWQQP